MDYDTILNEMRYNEFKGTVDEDLTRRMNLKMQLTLMSSINRN